MKKVYMITETFWDFKIEEDSKNKQLYLMGVFSEAENKNHNGRVYPKQILEREVNKLMKDSIKNKSCIGQIGHPEDTPETNLEKAAIITEDLKWNDNR